MSNVRVVVNNLADTAVLESAPAVGSLVVSNLQSDAKGTVFRTAGTSTSFEAGWGDDQAISLVAIPACNLTNTASVTITLTNSLGVQVYSETLDACPGSLNGGDAITVNDFAYGQASKVVIWLQRFTGIRSVLVEIEDLANTSGFIDLSRLVIGDYWSPQFGTGYTAEYTLEDLSQNKRTEAGDLLSTRQPIIERITFNLNALGPTDRQDLLRIAGKAGVYKNILVAILPEDQDAGIRHSSVVYGKRQNSSIRFEAYQMYGSQFTVESW